MKDIMTNSGAFTRNKISALGGAADDTNTSVWTTIRIQTILDEIENGMDIKGLHNSPFKDNDISLKRANLPFEYTPEEWLELRKCKEDPVYWAYNYCMIQTSDGVQLIKDAGGLRDFQEQIVQSFKANKFTILMASRQTGKCFLPTEYIDVQYNVLDVTTGDKTKVQERLPFFELYFRVIKETRKLTFFEKVKYLLYKLYIKLDTNA